MVATGKYLRIILLITILISIISKACPHPLDLYSLLNYILTIKKTSFSVNMKTCDSFQLHLEGYRIDGFERCLRTGGCYSPFLSKHKQCVDTVSIKSDCC